MRLNEAGEIARDWWLRLEDRYPGITLDEFVFMPNHMHGIVVIGEIYDKCVGATNVQDAGVFVGACVVGNAGVNGGVTVGATGGGTVGAIHELPQRREPSAGELLPQKMAKRNLFDMHMRRKMLLPKIIGYFKMNSARDINHVMHKSGTKLWQRNYYEHIVRSSDELDSIRQYIRDNPAYFGHDVLVDL